MRSRRVLKVTGLDGERKHDALRPNASSKVIRHLFPPLSLGAPEANNLLQPVPATPLRCGNPVLLTKEGQEINY